MGAGPATVARLGKGSSGHCEFSEELCAKSKRPMLTAIWTSLREKLAGNLIALVKGLGTGTTCIVEILDSAGWKIAEGPYIRAVDESPRLAEDLELSHGSLELGHHELLVVFRRA